MDIENLKGRSIEDVPYSGLVESICAVNLICHTATEAAGHLSKEDLLSFFPQIVEHATKSLVFAGATREEIAQVTAHLLKGMRITREGQ